MKRPFSLPFGITLMFAFWLSLGSTPTMGQTPRPSADSYEEILQALRSIELDESRVATVSNLVLSRDAGTFTFEDGTFALTRPIAGRTVVAVFGGRGQFSLDPPLDVEKASLNRYFEKPTLDESFRTAVLIFADETLTELESQLMFAPGELPKDGNKELEEAIKYLSLEEDDHLDSHLLTPFLNGQENTLFYAHFSENRGDPLIFMVNPYEVEEISVSKRADKSRRKDREIVTQFHTVSEYESGTLEEPGAKDLVLLDNYHIESSIAEELDFSAAATFDLTTVQDGLRWVPLDLYFELEVESVMGADGTPLPFARAHEQTPLWIDLGMSTDAGTTRRVTVNYQGELLEWMDVWDTGPGVSLIDADAFLIRTKSSINWYPKASARRRANFDLVFRAPVRFRTASVGNKVSDEIEGATRVTHWRAEQVRNTGFNLGEFEEYPIPNSRGGPAITLQVAEQFHEQLALDLSSSRVPGFELFLGPVAQQADIVRAVGGDVTNAFAFFQNVFGPSPVDEFYATVIPLPHGEAFPGMIHLFWMTYQLTGDSGGDETFRSHEVAHQWWGIAVDYESYRDRWLSEGFSEYASLWYLEVVRGDEENFYKRLEASSDLIREARDPAPTALGHRAASRERPENYSTMVYQKGAWVLHMLRSVMADWETLDDSRFIAAMSEFYQTHTGRMASTEDFKAVIEKHMGEPMDWFFDQWVYGLDLPKYRFEYELTDAADGTFTAQINIKQENVSEDFKMYIPIEVDYGPGSSEYRQVLVEGPETSVQITGIRTRPERLRFNAFYGVLTEDIDGERWKWDERR